MRRSIFIVQIRRFQRVLAKVFGFWLFFTIALAGALAAFVEFVGFDIPFLNKGDRMQSLLIFIVSAILGYIVVERATILDEIRDRIQVSQAHLYPTREATYMAAAQIMAEASGASQRDRRILLTALHGDGGRRLAKVTHTNPAFAAFDMQMDRLVASSGPDMWQVRHLFNITDEDRLEMIINYLKKAGDAEGYEVRAFSLPNTLPHLSVLTIGDEDLLIGVDDPRYYRVSRAFHLQGRDYVEAAAEYFDSLWNDPRVFVLRSATGVEWEEIEKLRTTIKSRSEVT